jgi:predicted enzyme related to lactoylglutathione lyase
MLRHRPRRIHGEADVTESHGRFSWYELLTTDMEAARTFYADVVGWGTQDASEPGNAYTFFRIGQAPVSGMMNLPEEVRRRGGSQCWIGYVTWTPLSRARVNSAVQSIFRRRTFLASAVWLSSPIHK